MVRRHPDHTVVVTYGGGTWNESVLTLTFEEDVALRFSWDERISVISRRAWKEASEGAVIRGEPFVKSTSVFILRSGEVAIIGVAQWPIDQPDERYEGMTPVRCPEVADKLNSMLFELLR